jgi:hypothetical protein
MFLKLPLRRITPVLKVGRIVKLWRIIAASDPTVTTAYISHAACLRQQTGKHHPESPQRLYAIEVIGRDHRLH